MRYFEKSHSASILIALYENGKLFYSQLLKVLGHGGGTISSTIEYLKNLGLIIDEVEDKFGGRRYLYLTEKGKKVAKHLIEIKKIMEGE